MSNELKKRIDMFIANKASMGSVEREDYLKETLDSCDIPYSKYDPPMAVLINLINRQIKKKRKEMVSE